MIKKKIYILVIGLILVVLVILGVSYALLQKNIVGDNGKIIYQVGDLEVKLDETSSKDISLVNAIPIEDSDGLKNEPYSFLLVNNAVTDLKYTIYLEDDADAKNKCGSDCELIPYNFIRCNLSNDSNSLKTNSLVSSSTELYTGTIESKSTDKFNLRVWLSIDADNSAMGKYYFGKLKVVLSQADDYCIRNDFTKLSDCMLVMNDHESNVETAKQNIVSKGTPDFSKVATTDEGLFMAEDDEGPSYYYRGAVKNNYVSFTGFMWRIIRQNGDGSIRMIYAGKKTNDKGEATIIGKSAFNEKYWDPTYVGYKYGEKFLLYNDNKVTNYTRFNAQKKYDFGSNYSFDEVTRKFALTGTISELSLANDSDEIINNTLYTCFETDCNLLYKVSSYEEGGTLYAYVISYSSTDKLSTLANDNDSSIGLFTNTWYKQNLIAYSSYISDEIFCNDRSINSGTGYKVDDYTFYSPYARLVAARIPTLKCKQEEDRFMVGNDVAHLNYPIALITADEVAMAGAIGVLNGTYIENENLYLNGQYEYYTMSPTGFARTYSDANVLTVSSSGSLLHWRGVNNTYGVRPVINLKADVKISSGDGTSIAPYKIATN